MSSTVTTRPATGIHPRAAEPSAAPRSPRSRFVRHAVVLAKRNLIKTARTPEQLIDVTIQPIIFLLLFVYVFGGAISGHGTLSDRHAYLEYLLPGLFGQGIAMGSVALGQNLNADIEKGVFDRFRSLPIARSAPLVGAVLADFFRYFLLCGIFVGFGYVLGFRIHANPAALVAALAVAIAFALCFCWISVWVGLKARTSGSVQGIMFLLIFPLTFGSSTFVPASTMPGWLQGFVKVNPITHLVGTVRGLMLGTGYGTDLLWTACWCAGLLIVFVPLAMRAYKRRV